METAIVNTEDIVHPHIPEVFIAEYLDGIPMYYKGYKSIINTPSQIEAIMGAGAIHSILVSYFVTLLAKNLDESQFCVLTGETGYKGEKKNLFNLDVAVYSVDKLPDGQLHYEFMTIAPELVVEADTSVESNTVTEDEYIFTKTQRLLDFGTQKVIWFFSKTRKIMVAQPTIAWQIYDWNVDIAVMEGISFNVYEYCKQKRYLNLLNLSA